MPTPMTAEERELRLHLDESVRRVRSALGACPAIDDLDFVDLESAAAVANQASRALTDAMAYTDALENLREASQEAVLIAATSRTALGVVREVLTVLRATIDCRRAA